MGGGNGGGAKLEASCRAHLVTISGFNEVPMPRTLSRARKVAYIYLVEPITLFSNNIQSLLLSCSSEYYYQIYLS